ncbi:hypothetical protein NEUTE1DRAFT_75342 [Neurospora tetrasperma FGSC 2508]|uniref:Glycoside hydrolase n=1 Tax=Neurospora tetrasperma (strain FGSC 2508 / ATCC MYA-4615 / P0657) TaxID=510951 RepID=F8MC04_NEUT8|nr:uncharacterized protein NEUTE1DRAFT_75342 [Neurospora tetrasperma FGSC 2508]EGO60358.1 hypothetical protein NEUTE1DRAFT_75342 [Neurospora tetrasperma FGSC 2508]EGZ75667.1 hypothetical protein NEUTE2DRAFT_105717 [Neurospora tetrasperma FGSC 2509]
MWSASWLLLGAITSVASQDTGNHPDWPRWCGKVYKPDYPSFDPGGQTLPPTPDPLAPLLHVQFKPRYSLYLESEKTGEFIVNAEISQFHGTHWGNNTSNNVEFHIKSTTDNKVLVQDSIPVNSTGKLFTFNLTDLTPSLSPIQVTLTYSPEGPSVKTTLLYLPAKSSGSVTRIDNLNGGLHHLNSASNHTFKPIFPYGFYASYDNFLALPNSSSVIQSYFDLGLTGMVPLTHYPESASAFAYMDSINLAYMFDLRENYTNQTWVKEQVTAASTTHNSGEALFAYWSVDEPDGWQAPFSAPLETYKTISSVDPYHPVALVLNCQNYYFSRYTAGADILMADIYPIGIRESSANLTNSKWGTPCNSTYGDCGCDNCAGSVLDVPKRFEDMNTYEKWLGVWPKSKMLNPQAFHGEGYWARDPSAEESWAMVLLAINRGVKGILSWVWPASEELGKAHGRLARVVSSGEGEDGVVVGLLVEGRGPEKLQISTGVKGVDAAGWVDKEGEKMLVSVVNTGEEDIEGLVELEVPSGSRVGKVVWDESGGAGDGKWEVKEGKLTKNGLKGMGTALVILELSG